MIVAGMPRTGTESIKRALEILYGNHARAYHMSEVLNRPKHLQVWADLAFERIQPEQVNWQEFLGGYIATTDMPCALYFEQLAAAFPDAKIILSLRDGPRRIIMQAVQKLSITRLAIAAGILVLVLLIVLLVAS
ncbi:sulfotransferase family protein [Rivularia sp. UHCC 0363]|uniref:sulfotransferase family protein n=1 Tax=Rivularia sp. UHCC 0363 TaxID=3110244 RepID=UPI002B1FDF5E|nr:sulfotransferase [Rivularia sp. UHCC 0363]MEA5599133.1 sulfotransferase [Rivularia sp. UHCC 0363]